MLITGGYGYLGKGIVENLKLNGANVWVLGRSKSKFDEAFPDSEGIKFLECDISESKNFQSAFETVFNQEKRIDAVINNAFYLRGQSPEGMTDEDFNYGMEGSLTSIYSSIREIIPYFKKQGFGAIVNTSSMYGMVAPDFTIYDDCPQFLNPPHYGAAKAGLIQLTKYYAHYLGPNNVRVNAVSPGPFPSETVQKDTAFVKNLEDHTALRRIGKPEDLGGIFSFLCSDAATYITGQNIAVDGGWTSK